MSNLKTITEVTKSFGISTRTLRYYEQLGLIQSQRVQGYSYRVYDAEACTRINQILIQNIHAINIEIDSLSTIRSILNKFVGKYYRFFRNSLGVILYFSRIIL